MDYHVTDVAIRNDEQHGYWIIVDKKIYDVTSFMDLHPGGAVILMNSAGRDASNEFKAALHHGNPRIEALLKKFYVGNLLEPQIESESLKFLYQQWYAFLQLILEMENTFKSDLSFLSRPCTFDDFSTQISPYKIDLLLEAHSRFLNGYLQLIHDKLEVIQESTQILIDYPHSDLADMFKSVRDPSMSNRSVAMIRENNAMMRRKNAQSEVEHWDEDMQTFRALIEKENTNLLATIKSELINGLKIFELNTDIENIAMLMPFHFNMDTAVKKYWYKIETEGRHFLFRSRKLLKLNDVDS